MTINEVFVNTDWKELSKQKDELYRVILSVPTVLDGDLLEGLLNFLDAVQDAAHLEGYPVFTKTS